MDPALDGDTIRREVVLGIERELEHIPQFLSFKVRDKRREAGIWRVPSILPKRALTRWTRRSKRRQPGGRNRRKARVTFYPLIPRENSSTCATARPSRPIPSRSFAFIPQSSSMPFSPAGITLRRAAVR